MGGSEQQLPFEGGTYYPRVLICALTRVNKEDLFNNNLLLRNLFADWPRERLGQIYSGGSNNDDGFCGYQYQIGSHDRRFGNLFFRLKRGHLDSSHNPFSVAPGSVSAPQLPLSISLKKMAGKFLMNSGLYELLFKIKASKKLINFCRKFDPEIILAQGYNLSFTWLPLLLKKKLNKPIVYYGSDDWPTYLYSSRGGLCALTAPLIRKMVAKSSSQLFAKSDIQFSFNAFMSEEYKRRYGKSFIPLMHCDDPKRFELAEPIRLQPENIKSIVVTGSFDASRWPLLRDLEEVCRRLNNMGVPTRATVLKTRITDEGYRELKSFRFVELQDDPGHELLPSYLKGADLLYLPETFDVNIASGYRYSISTKAHLFMFSQRPIIVYGHPKNGLLKYARCEGWGFFVDQKNVDLLTKEIKRILSDKKICQKKLIITKSVVMRNHDCKNVRNIFHKNIISSCLMPTCHR